MSLAPTSEPEQAERVKPTISKAKHVTPQTTEPDSCDARPRPVGITTQPRLKEKFLLIFILFSLLASFSSSPPHGRRPTPVQSTPSGRPPVSTRSADM